MAFTAAPISSALAQNESAPLNYFLHSYGPASMPTLYLGWVFVALVLAVFFAILLLMMGALFRKRPTENPNAIGREDQGMEWIYIGTGVSTCILFALAIYALTTLNLIAKPSRPPALTLTVTGFDWWWKVEYENKDPTHRFITANEIHIPVGQPVLIKLKSADVVHAFWVPTLAGKTQMIPGLTNQQWLQADTEGIFKGQCTQYCGLQHAHMGFEIIAQNPSEFKKWLDSQRSDAVIVSAVDASEGKKIFLEQCAGCHAVRGTEAMGNHAPDLTHLKSRRLIAAGLLTNTPENLKKWIAQVQALKPGSRMPSFIFTATQFSALSAYLSTLK